jgi:glutathione S-transferase
MEAPRTLVVLPVSPWSERVRWALDHHGLAHRVVEHVPVIGERRLRKLVGRREGPATVPVLIEGDTVLTESWDIAMHADRIGNGALLLPAARVADIRRWSEQADAVMKHGRALVVGGMLKSPGALDEAMPATVPALVRRILRPVNRWGTGWFARKYGVPIDDPAAHLEKLREGLLALREGLRGGTFLLGEFSYADMIMATVIQGVVPVADEYIRIGPATRAVWTQPALAEEFADLVRWRDELYRARRRRV